MKVKKTIKSLHLGLSLEPCKLIGMGIENVGLEKPTLSIAIANAYMSKNISVTVSVKSFLSFHTVIKSQDQHLVQLIMLPMQTSDKSVILLKTCKRSIPVYVGQGQIL